MNLNRHRYRGPLVAALAPLLLALPAQAASLIETAVVHATACHPDGDASDLFFYNSNGMGNKHKTATLFVTCPVPFAVPFDTGDPVKLGAGGTSCTSNADNQPWVEVYDRSSIQNVSCTLFFKFSNGQTESAFTANTLGTATGVQRLVFQINGPVGPGLNLVMGCRIPPLAGDFSFVSNMGVTTCAVTP
jgi:hypothetical protein